jgi:hypothetical protein
MKHAALALSIALALLEPGFAAPPDARLMSEKMARNTFSVFSLFEGQERSLDAIIAQFPDLRLDAAMARVEFDQAFGASIKALDDFLTENSSPDSDWPTLKETRIRAALGELDFSQVSRQEALDYIETVKKRTKGDIPQGIYQVLVAFHPLYSREPHMEIVNGYSREYTSDGTGKSLGIKVSIEYPRSWEAADGRRPHILQNFESPDCSASAGITVWQMPLLWRLSSEQDNLDYLSSKEYIEEEMPGAIFLASGKTTIAGKTAAFCDAMVTRSAPAGDFTDRQRTYCILHKGKLVTLTFNVGAAGIHTRDEMNAAFLKYEKLFGLMATSLDFFDKYE